MQCPFSHCTVCECCRHVDECACTPNLGRLERIFWNDENLTICWCIIIVKITATFHTDELLVSKAVGKYNVPFQIVQFVSVVGMCPCSPNLSSLEGIFGKRENLTICWCVVVYATVKNLHEVYMTGASCSKAD